jgi:tRNA 2-selenouridine synthase
VIALPPGPPPRAANRVSVDEIASFADRIDVRSPAEYADDHVPGAINLPVLDDAERAEVGTLYAQVSAFDARKLGAAIVARNIADIVARHVQDKPREWAPLVYCWRGGQRSRALAHVLNEIGFRAAQLDGGYRAYRRRVVRIVAQLPPTFDYRVVCGLTGSGKSRLIAAIAAEGGQVLDLECLARHRGSLLGDLPGEPQPSQKAFESALVDALARLDASRPVYVESESQRIGRLQVPPALLESMRAAPCLRLETPKPQRVALLVDDYAHLVRDRALFVAQIAPLAKLHGKATIERWRALADAGSAAALTGELLDVHYDPSYARAISRNFPRYGDAAMLHLDDASDEGFRALARHVLDRAKAAQPA